MQLLADHFDRNGEDGHEADEIREQRDDGRQKQQAERASRRLLGTAAIEHGIADRTDLLHAVRDADREDDERHEDAERVHAVAEQHEQPQLPHHGDRRAQHRHERDAERLDVQPHE